MKIFICICLVLTVYALGDNWAQGHWTRGQSGGSSWTHRTVNRGGTQSSAGKVGCTHRHRTYWGNGNRGGNYWGGGYWSRSHRGGDGWRVNHWDSSSGRRLRPNYNRQFRNHFRSGFPLTRPTYNDNGEFISKPIVVLTPKSSETINDTEPNSMTFDRESRREMEPKTIIQTFAHESNSKQETIHNIDYDSNRLNNTDLVDIIKNDSPLSEDGVAVTEKIYLQEPYDPFSDYVEVE